MAYKPAKNSFTKDEVTEILRQNLILFKNEPDFPEYFINLGLYLIDQAYATTGARSTGLDKVLAAYTKLKNETGVSITPGDLEGLLAHARGREDQPPAPPERVPPHRRRSQGAPPPGHKPDPEKERGERFDPVFKNPPMPTKPVEAPKETFPILTEEVRGGMSALPPDKRDAKGHRPEPARPETPDEDSPAKPHRPLPRFQNPTDESQHPFGPARNKPFGE